MSYLLIYTNILTNRFSYITETLFGEDVLITYNPNYFLSHNGPKINYSSESISEDEIWIKPHGLLQSNTIETQNIEMSSWHSLPAFFVTAENAEIPFDILSASFYLISRYEEYLPHEKDIYGRYAHWNSLAHQQNFLRIPLVNYWMKALKTILEGRYPNFASNKIYTFRYTPTYDIDIAFSILGKSVLSNSLKLIGSVVKGRIADTTRIIKTWIGKEKDPFDTFEWLDELHEQYSLHPIYFCLTLLESGKYDKNLPAYSPKIIALFKQLATKYILGIHPSWISGDKHSLLMKEKEKLETILEQPIKLSRNHYLRFNLPETYRRLIDAGIEEDYSMAYSTINGFRASYTHSFYWYDLSKEAKTELLIHPFCYMEANSYFEQKCTAEQAAEELVYYYNTVKEVEGHLITLFHNHFLTEEKNWQPWRDMYAAFLENIQNDVKLQ